MKTTIALLVALVCWGMARATGDTLYLQQCREKALAQSPLQQQKLLSLTKMQLQDQNLKAAWLPQFSMQGQMVYLSDVVTFPKIGIPGEGFPEIPHFQYQLAGRISQNIYDGGATRLRREMNALDQQLQQEQLEVELYPIHEVINQLYFGVLMLQARADVLKEARLALQERLKVIRAGIRHGTVLESQAELLEKELVKIDQQLDQLATDRQASLNMLGAWIGRQDMQQVVLLPPPEAPFDSHTAEIQRPEQRLFELQKNKIQLGLQLSRVKYLPKFGAFVNGGIGQPNPLNFLETNTQPFYQLGVSFQWSPPSWKEHSRQKQIAQLDQQAVDARLAHFDQQLHISLIREQERVASYLRQIELDQRMISLQQAIVKRMAAGVENGTTTPTDYLIELHQLSQAQLQQKIHRLLYLQALETLRIRMGANE
ncbi:MAG: TolC family protein [Bacteroidetes bacterium]|nr:MAG: TolC family protein [Bacteroidota bacterium]